MRAAIFIDGGYLLNQMQDAKQSPDYGRLAEHLLAPLRRATPVDLMRCYFYYCAPWTSERPTETERRRLAAHERFVAEIHKLDRWQVRLGKLERRREGDRETYAQKRVDVQLSVDLVRHAAGGHAQHVILVAGDSDFIPAIVAAKEAGATLTLWCDDDKSVHKDLLVHADQVQFIDWKTFPTRAARPEDAISGKLPRARTRRGAKDAVPEAVDAGAEAEAGESAERESAGAPPPARGWRQVAAAAAAAVVGRAGRQSVSSPPAPAAAAGGATGGAGEGGDDGEADAAGDAPVKTPRRRGRRGGRGRGKKNADATATGAAPGERPAPPPSRPPSSPKPSAPKPAADGDKQSWRWADAPAEAKQGGAEAEDGDSAEAQAAPGTGKKRRRRRGGRGRRRNGGGSGAPAPS